VGAPFRLRIAASPRAAPSGEPSSRRGPTTTPSAVSACRSPPDRTSHSRRRSRRWRYLDRTPLLAKESALSGSGFGADVREAKERRIDHLVEQGLARRHGQRVIFARDLINTLHRRELASAASKLSADTGLTHRTSAEGEHVSGIYHQRVTLASGRFTMIDDGLGFQLVPWGRRSSGGWVSRCQVY